MLKKSLGILLLVAAAPAIAGDLSYNYIEAGFQRIEFDDVAGVDVDGDGFGIGGSFELNDDWFIRAGYSTADLDFGIDLDQTILGIGYRADISPATDVFATVSYVRADVSATGFGSFDDDGFGISVGVRGMLTDKVELSGSIGYIDLDEGGDGTSVSAGGLYNFTDMFAAGVGIEVDEDVTTFGILGRLYFGN